jgi:hypothetical protein
MYTIQTVSIEVASRSSTNLKMVHTELCSLSIISYDQYACAYDRAGPTRSSATRATLIGFQEVSLDTDQLGHVTYLTNRITTNLVANSLPIFPFLPGYDDHDDDQLDGGNRYGEKAKGFFLQVGESTSLARDSFY